MSGYHSTTRPRVSAKLLDMFQRHQRILGMLVDHHQPRSYFKNLGLSRSLKWLVDHEQIAISRSGNVHITDVGRSRLART